MVTTAQNIATECPDPEEKKDVRLYARVAKKVKVTIDAAAELTGSTANQFMAQAAYQAAQDILQRERAVRLSEEATSQFLDLLDNPSSPNTALRSAVAAYKQSSLNADI